MKYNIHIYAVTRVKVINIEADSKAEACAKAEDKVDLHAILDREGEIETEWAEEVLSFTADPLLPNGEVNYDDSEYLSVGQVDKEKEKWKDTGK